MAVNDYLKNTRLGPPPLQTPITADQADQFGLPFQFRSDDAPVHGNLHQSWASWLKGAGQRLNDLPAIVDTHANRISTSNPAPAVPPPPYRPDRYLGMFYYETDRNALYVAKLVSNVPAWVWIGGECAVTQANLPNDLGVNDAGFIAIVTDYMHRLRWSGSAWGWAPGESGSGMLEMFAVAPGAGWHACDGSTVNYLKSDGTLGAITLPNTAASAAYAKLGGSYAAWINAATVPSVVNPTNTGAHTLTLAEIPSHIHGLTQVRYSSSYGTGSLIALNGTGAAISQTTDPAGGGGGHDHTIGNPTVTLPGDPVANFQALLYFRQ